MPLLAQLVLEILRKVEEEAGDEEITPVCMPVQLSQRLTLFSIAGGSRPGLILFAFF